MNPLSGPLAKVERANSQIITLDKSLQGCFKRYPYTVSVAEFDAQAGHYPLRVQGGPPVFPDKWGVLIGEIAHNLRSALDGLTWQLALLNTAKPYGRTAFPIYLIGRTIRKRKSGADLISHFWGKGDGKRLLQSVDGSFWTRIESFQPYKRGNRGRHSPLFLLEELNNSDKHRLITVLAPTMVSMKMSGLTGQSTIYRTVMLKRGAHVGHVLPLPYGGIPVLKGVVDGRPLIEIQHDVQVDGSITPVIRFGDRCHAVNGFPVILTLRSMADEVSRVIELFRADLK